MTQALVLMIMVCWGPGNCHSMQKEVDSVEQCISELAFVKKDVEKMRERGSPFPEVQQFMCTYITGKE